MFERVFSRDGRILAERLRRDALVDRPDFSPALHQRLCHAVRQSRARRATAPRHESQRGLTARWVAADRPLVGWAALSMATMGVLAMVVFVWRPSGSHEPLAAQRAADPTASLAALVSLPDRATNELERWLTVATADPQWAFLGHDARLAAEMLVGDLPRNLPAAEVHQEQSGPSS